MSNGKTLKLVYLKNQYLVHYSTFLFPDNTYFASYADDNTPYTINQNTDSVTKSLEELSTPVLTWFKENKIN